MGFNSAFKGLTASGGQLWSKCYNDILVSLFCVTHDPLRNILKSNLAYPTQLNGSELFTCYVSVADVALE